MSRANLLLIFNFRGGSKNKYYYLSGIQNQVYFYTLLKFVKKNKSENLIFIQIYFYLVEKWSSLYFTEFLYFQVLLDLVVARIMDQIQLAGFWELSQYLYCWACSDDSGGGATGSGEICKTPSPLNSLRFDFGVLFTWTKAQAS